MSRRLYTWSRDLHLYCGQFISPFILVFAVSVFFLSHGRLGPALPSAPETLRDVRTPAGLDQLQGREAVDRARELLPQLGLTGEIGFLRSLRKERHVVFPVSRPGSEATVDVDLDARSAVVSARRTGWWETLAYLHKSPGPHNVNMRSRLAL